MKLLVVTTSVRKGRAGEKVANWFVDQVKKDGRFEPELVDLRELNLSYELSETLAAQVQDGQYEFEETRKWAALVSAADAVVFVTPEYNHGYPASLKNAVDHLYNEWNGKPVGFVNYGASGAPFSFIAFTFVADWVHMDLVMPRVAIPEIWAAFDEDGTIAHAEYREYEVNGVLGALENKVTAKK